LPILPRFAKFRKKIAGFTAKTADPLTPYPI